MLDGGRSELQPGLRAAPERGRRALVPHDGRAARPAGGRGRRVSHTDVTERRHAEAEAQKSRQELAHFLRVSTIGELTTSIAHELNQPLAAILANAQTARKLLAAPAIGRERGARSARSSPTSSTDDRRAGEVIRRLRELLRKGEGTQEELDVNALVRDVLQAARQRRDAPRGQLAARSSPRETLLVRGDRVQLQQVLLNLVVNALEALSETDGDWRIGDPHRAGCRAAWRACPWRTRARACPRPSGARSSSPSSRTKAKGMGMGLSIATVDPGRPRRHDLGRRRHRERGARFTFTLPLRRGGPPTPGGPDQDLAVIASLTRADF